MRSIRYFSFLLLVFSAPVASAQPAPVIPPPVYKRPAPQIEPAAREMLGALSARYEALRSYSDVTRFEIEDEQAMGAKEAAARGLRARISWQRPDKVRLEGEAKAGHFLAVSDGKMIWAQKEARPGVYMRRAAGVWAARDAALEVEPMLVGIQFFFERGYIERRVFRDQDLVSLSTRADAEVEGTLCHAVEAHVSNGDGMEIIHRFFIAIEGGSLRRLAITIAGGQNRSTFIETHSDVRFNPVLEASTWTFTPSRDAKPVESFSGYVPRSLGPNVKVGEVLPDFTALTTEGKPLSLSDLRGKVVILYFYHPNIAEDASKLADVARRYDAQGLQVVAVMMDTRREMIPSTLDGRPVPYLFLFDEKGSEGIVPTLYAQKALGWMYLIDRQGRLQRVGRDWSDLEFSGDIETLLAQPQ